MHMHNHFMALLDFVWDYVFYRPDALPAAQPTTSKHWRQSL